MTYAKDWEGPLLLVGASRSGTAMVRSMLNNHPDIKLAGETHYFDDLRCRIGGPGGDGLGTDELTTCADYFRALDDRPYGMFGDPNNSPVPRDEFIKRSVQLGGSADAFFESYCRLVAEREKKRIWGEKTPRHVFRIGDIFATFPDSRVICMIRDPRAVVASYRDWRNQGGLNEEEETGYSESVRLEEQRARQSYNIIIATMLWKASVNAAEEAVKKFGRDRVWIQNYERVVAEPEGSLGQICDWMDLNYTDNMLHIPMHNSSVSPFSKDSGISSAPVERWRSMLTDREIAVVEKIAGNTLLSAGYERTGVSLSLISFAVEWLKVAPAILRAIGANRARTGNLYSYVWLRIRMSLGI